MLPWLGKHRKCHPVTPRTAAIAHLGTLHAESKKRLSLVGMCLEASNPQTMFLIPELVLGEQQPQSASRLRVKLLQGLTGACRVLRLIEQGLWVAGLLWKQFAS